MIDTNFSLSWPTGDIIARDCSCLLPAWANVTRHAVEAAQAICEGYFNDAYWAEHIGTEDSCATIEVEIHSPEPIKGKYQVSLERRTKATAIRMLPVFAESVG